MDPDTPQPPEGDPGIDIDERLTIVRIGGDLRDRLLATLEGAGWQVVGPDDLPFPDPGLLALPPLDDLERELETARSFGALADAELAESLAEMSAVCAQLDDSERRRAELDGLADLSGAEVAETRHLADSTERLSRIVEGAVGLGLDEHVAAISEWIDGLVAGTAPAHPTAVELVARQRAIGAELSDGAGSPERSPAILEAHARRHELRSLIVELEGMVERGLTAESRKMIESANAERVRAEEAGGRRGAGAVRDALAAEEAVLARFGYASFPDYQISTSTRSVGEHAEATLIEVRARLADADRDLAAAEQAAEARRDALQRESAEVGEAIEALAQGRSIEGIVATPEAVALLGDQVRAAAEAELATSAGHQARLIELQPITDHRTQEASRAEGDLERLEADRDLLARSWLEAVEAVARCESELTEKLTGLALEAPVVLLAEVPWLTGERLMSILEQAALGGPIVWCTDRADTTRGSDVVAPTRWWQFRRRVRQTTLAG